MADRGAANQDRRHQPLQDVVDEIWEQGGAAGAPPPALIPIVETLESSIDLPPDWNFPNLQAGVANNVPPLPPSLGSASGRRSSASGHTSQGRPAVPQPGGRGASDNRHRGSRAERHRSSHSQESRTISEGSRNVSAGYVNAGSGEQRTGDRFEGPALPAEHRVMGGEPDAGGPPIPARNLDLGTPARPSNPHPGRQAPRAFGELGDRAYSA